MNRVLATLFHDMALISKLVFCFEFANPPSSLGVVPAFGQDVTPTEASSERIFKVITAGEYCLKVMADKAHRPPSVSDLSHLVFYLNPNFGRFSLGKSTYPCSLKEHVRLQD